MSVPETGVITPADTAPKRRRTTWWWVPLGLVAVLVFLSLLELVTDANDLSSSGAIAASLGAMTPIMLAGLGGLWSERAGVVNIGLEGMMILGTFGAALIAYDHGAWAGVIGGIAFGAVGGVIHAVATVIFGVDHIVSGVAINIIALGAVQYLAAVTFGEREGGSATKSPPLPDLPAISWGWASDELLVVERKEIFFVSEVAALLRALVTNLSWLVVISFLLALLTYLVLWRTSFGLRLRSCGESPAAAESLGIAVMRYKFVAVVISGGFAGLGGCFLAMVASSSYRDGQTGNRGYIGLAAMIFGNWRPGGLLAGSGLFGYTETLGLRGGGGSVRALLLAMAAIAVALGVWQLRKRNVVSGAVLVVLGIGIGVLYFAIDEVPSEFTTMTPYVITLLVLGFASQRLRIPAADGQVYRKGSAG
jgi:ABC-type uncharacterized transport system permease subunit